MKSMHQMDLGYLCYLVFITVYIVIIIGTRIVVCGYTWKIYHLSVLVYAHWFMSIRISQLKDCYISVDQNRHDTYVVAKYVDTSTIK